MNNNVVQLNNNPMKRAAPKKAGDDKLADDIRKAQKKLCRAIDAATKAGLKIELLLDASDTWGGGKVRCRDVKITKGL